MPETNSRFRGPTVETLLYSFPERFGEVAGGTLPPKVEAVLQAFPILDGLCARVIARLSQLERAFLVRSPEWKWNSDFPCPFSWGKLPPDLRNDLRQLLPAELRKPFSRWVSITIHRAMRAGEWRPLWKSLFPRQSRRAKEIKDRLLTLCVLGDQEDEEPQRQARSARLMLHLARMFRSYGTVTAIRSGREGERESWERKTRRVLDARRHVAESGENFLAALKAYFASHVDLAAEPSFAEWALQYPIDRTPYAAPAPLNWLCEVQRIPTRDTTDSVSRLLLHALLLSAHLFDRKTKDAFAHNWRDMWTRSLAFAEELGQQPSDEERAQAEELFKTIGGVLYECMTVREIVDWAKLRPLSKRAPVLRPAAKPTDEIRRTFALRMKQAFDGFHCYSDGSKDLKQARRDFVDAALLAVEGREHARSTRLAVYKRLGI